jgi:hypothetical protein
MWSADTTLGKDMLFMLFSDQHFRVGHKEREVGVRKKRNRPKTARNDRIAYCALRDNDVIFGHASTLSYSYRVL